MGDHANGAGGRPLSLEDIADDLAAMAQKHESLVGVYLPSQEAPPLDLFSCTPSAPQAWCCE
jgi:hypothetical protein